MIAYTLDGRTAGGVMNMHTEAGSQIGPIENISPREEWLTDFYPIKKKEYFKYLDETNRGKQNGPKWRNNRYYTASETRCLIEAVADSLDLSIAQKRTAIRSFQSLDFRELGLDKVLVSFSTCAYIVHRDAETRRCHPQTKEGEVDEYFQRVRQNLGISDRDFNKTYHKVQHRLRG